MSWGLRLRGMEELARDELHPLVAQIERMKFSRLLDSGERQNGVTLIRDLRPALGA